MEGAYPEIKKLESDLEEIINSEKTPAQTLLENYNNKWNRDITKLIEEMSY